MSTLAVSNEGMELAGVYRDSAGLRAHALYGSPGTVTHGAPVTD